MQIDGDQVSIGDHLYDLFSEQMVKVVSLFEDTMKVSYGDGTCVEFNGAYLNGVRRLYWHDPRTFIPGKNEINLIYKVREIVEVLRA